MQATPPLTAASISADPAYQITNAELPYDEAVALVKRKARGRVIHLNASTWLPLKVQNPAHHSRAGHVVTGYVEVSKDVVLKWLDDAIHPHARPKVNVRVGYSKRCLFVGSCL